MQNFATPPQPFAGICRHHICEFSQFPLTFGLDVSGVFSRQTLQAPLSQLRPSRLTTADLPATSGRVNFCSEAVEGVRIPTTRGGWRLVMSEPKSRLSAFLEGMGRTLDLGATIATSRIEKMRPKLLISPRQALASDSQAIIHDSRKALDRLVSEISAKAGQSGPAGNYKICKLLQAGSVSFITLRPAETPACPEKFSKGSRSTATPRESPKSGTVFLRCKAFIKSGTSSDTDVHPIIVNIKETSGTGEYSGKRTKTIVS